MIPGRPPADFRLTAGSPGFFWFFLESNVEMVVKLLFGCPVNEHFWVFAGGGLTDVQVEMTVTDSQTGAVRAQLPQPAGHRVPADPGHQRLRHLPLSPVPC